MGYSPCHCGIIYRRERRIPFRLTQGSLGPCRARKKVDKHCASNTFFENRKLCIYSHLAIRDNSIEETLCAVNVRTARFFSRVDRVPPNRVSCACERVSSVDLCGSIYRPFVVSTVTCHIHALMTYQEIREMQRFGKLSERNISQLLQMSTICAGWLQSANKDDSGVKDAVDDEIRRKETKAHFDNLVKQTDNLTTQTNKLVGQVVELVGIAAAQKRLAEKLDVQTDRLISLTVWLKGLTIGLLILTLALCIFEALHFC